jgi:hypothetical protein
MSKDDEESGKRMSTAIATLESRFNELERGLQTIEKSHNKLGSHVKSLEAAQQEILTIVRTLPKSTSNSMPQVKQDPATDSRTFDPRDNDTATATESRRPATPSRLLEKLGFFPEDEPVRFQEWVDRILQFRTHYGLSDVEAISELEWYGGTKLEERLRLIRSAEPQTNFEHLCELLVKAAMPASAAQSARRTFHSCRQLDGESGSTFVRRFEDAVRSYRRFATPSDEDLYQCLLSQLNTMYVAEMRTDTAERGHLTQIEHPAARILAAYACVRQIDDAKGSSDKSYEELTSKTTKRVHTVTASGPLECRTCQRDGLPSNHDYRTCEIAKLNAYCHTCRMKGHFRSRSCPKTEPKTEPSVTVNKQDGAKPAGSDQ